MLTSTLMYSAVKLDTIQMIYVCLNQYIFIVRGFKYLNPKTNV